MPKITLGIGFQLKHHRINLRTIFWVFLIFVINRQNLGIGRRINLDAAFVSLKKSFGLSVFKENGILRIVGNIQKEARTCV